jgi:hypothetical protein
MSDEPQKPSDVQYSFDLRSRAISRTDPHSKSVKRIRSSDRLLLTAQNSIEEDADENTMATAAPERQVHVSTGSEMHTAQEASQADLTDMLHDQIQRLQSELRFAQAENREMVDKNRQLAANKKITDSIIAPKPFLGNTDEQQAGDWLNWFIKFADYKKLSDDERRDLFLVMLQGSASDWVSSFCEGSMRTPSFYNLKKAFEENYLNAKELRWKDASELWHEKQKSTEKVSDYVIRMKKLARNLEFPPAVVQMAILQGFRPAIRKQVIQKSTDNFDEMIKAAKLAESAEDSTGDASASALLSLMQSQISATEKHSDKLDKLSQTVAGLQADSSRKFYRPQNGNNFAQSSGRQLKPTPQNLQRLNYARFTRSTDQQATGARPFERTQPTGTVCGYCAYTHSQGNCPARGQVCRKCAKIGHFAKACRSVRRDAVNANSTEMHQAPANRQ